RPNGCTSLGCSLTNCAWSCHRSCAGEVERSAASSVNSCLWTAKNVQSLQTGDCLPMQSLRWSRPIGHDHYRNVRQSDPQIQHSQLDNWAADLRHRLPTAERFSATGFMEYVAWSFRLDVGPPDHLCPFCRVVRDELLEVGGRKSMHLTAQFRESRLDLGIDEPRIDCMIEPFDDLRRRILGRTNAAPATSLVAR